VAVDYRDIAESYERLRTFLLQDLELIVSRDTGGNYSATLLTMTACEALGRLRYGTESGGSKFFKEYVLPATWKDVSADLFDALRNGLAHSYETKMLVQFGARSVEIGISWRDHSHLSFDRDRSVLFLNVPELAAALRRAIDRYEGELRAQEPLRDRYRQWSKRKLEVHVQRQEQQEHWERLLREAEAG
jgi:hypothetical protein